MSKASKIYAGLFIVSIILALYLNFLNVQLPDIVTYRGLSIALVFLMMFLKTEIISQINKVFK